MFADGGEDHPRLEASERDAVNLVPPRPRVIQIIESEARRGCGHLDGSCGWNFKHTHEIMRIVVQYHTLEGEFLAERDLWREEQDTTPIILKEARG